MSTQEAVNVELPDYLKRAVNSPLTRTGVYALLTYEQYREMAEEVCRHARGEGCHNPKSCDVALVLKGLSDRSRPKRVLDAMLEGFAMVGHSAIPGIGYETHRVAQAVGRLNEVARDRNLKIRVEQA